MNPNNTAAHLCFVQESHQAWPPHIHRAHLQAADVGPRQPWQRPAPGAQHAPSLPGGPHRVQAGQISGSPAGQREVARQDDWQSQGEISGEVLGQHPTPHRVRPDTARPRQQGTESGVGTDSKNQELLHLNLFFQELLHLNLVQIYRRNNKIRRNSALCCTYL